MAGVTYTRNSIEFDHEKLQTVIDEHMGAQTVKVDSGLMFNSVEYYNYAASIGYAYNWVFAKNFLFCSSLSLALAYKSTHGESRSSKNLLDINNFNLDGIGRFGFEFLRGDVRNDVWTAIPLSPAQCISLLLAGFGFIWLIPLCGKRRLEREQTKGTDEYEPRRA